MMFLWNRCAQPAMDDEADGELRLSPILEETHGTPKAEEGQQSSVGPVLLGRLAVADDGCGFSSGSCSGSNGEEDTFAEFERFLEANSGPDLDAKDLVQFLRDLRGVSALQVMEECRKAWMEQGMDEGLEVLSAAVMADYACRQEEFCFCASAEGAEQAVVSGFGSDAAGPISEEPQETVEAIGELSYPSLPGSGELEAKFGMSACSTATGSELSCGSLSS